MVDTFIPPVNPSPNGTSVQYDFKILRADFGDGYSQRVPDGRNYKRKNATLSWDALNQLELNEILSFVDAHGGYIPFFYTLPDESVPDLFIATKPSKSYKEAGYYSLSISLERVYDVV